MSLIAVTCLWLMFSINICVWFILGWFSNYTLLMLFYLICHVSNILYIQCFFFLFVKWAVTEKILQKMNQTSAVVSLLSDPGWNIDDYLGISKWKHADLFSWQGSPQQINVWTWDCGLARIWLMLKLLCISSTLFSLRAVPHVELHVQPPTRHTSTPLTP